MMTPAMSPGYAVGVVTFEGATAAEGVVKGLTQVGDLNMVNDMAVLEHHADGKFSVNTFSDRPSVGQHAATGAAIGVAAGALLFGPIGLLAGLAGGAGVGASMGGDHRHELLLSPEFIQSLHDALPPDSSALLVIGEPDPVGEVIAQVRSKDVVSRKEFTHALTEAQSKVIYDALEQAGA
jgi:uncharacterized membrane protein